MYLYRVIFFKNKKLNSLKPQFDGFIYIFLSLFESLKLYSIFN